MTEEQRRTLRQVKQRVQLQCLRSTALHLLVAVVLQRFGHETLLRAEGSVALAALAVGLLFAAGWKYGDALKHAYNGYRTYALTLEEVHERVRE